MAYQGEDIGFTIKGDEVVNLAELDFKVLIYPCGSPEKVVILEKSEFTENLPNEFTGVIPYTETKKMETGQYAMEILIISDGGGR